jgi:DNA-binding MarR family transcriptional regulator
LELRRDAILKRIDSSGFAWAPFDRMLSHMSPASSIRTAQPVLSPELEFMRLLWAVEHGLQTTSKRMARRIGVTGPQRLALKLIGQFPSIAPSELAGLLRLHPSTVTGVLARLERRALIERHAHSHDARRVHLFVTASGRRMNRPIPGTVEEAVKRLLIRVGRHRVAVAERVLVELADALVADPGTHRRKRRDDAARPLGPRRRVRSTNVRSGFGRL